MATRYDKRDYIFNLALTVAAIVIWLRDIVQEPSGTPNRGFWLPTARDASADTD